MVEPNTAADIAIERVSISLYVLFAACVSVLQGFLNQQEMIKREPAPYGTCIYDWAETGMNWDDYLIWPGSNVTLPYSQGVV